MFPKSERVKKELVTLPQDKKTLIETRIGWKFPEESFEVYIGETGTHIDGYALVQNTIGKHSATVPMMSSVWRVKSGEEWLYLYLLIEFQSRSDRFMVLRMMLYVGLLYQDLIRNKQLGPHGLLPPVLPIVLYNGERRWHAPVSLAELLPKPPAFLAPLQAQMRYLLIDEGAIPAETLARLPQNLVAVIFKLEQPQTATVQALVTELEAATRSDEYTDVRRIVAIWIRTALIRNRKYDARIKHFNYETKEAKINVNGFDF